MAWGARHLISTRAPTFTASFDACSNFDSVALDLRRGVEADDVRVGAAAQRRQAGRRPTLRVHTERSEVDGLDHFFNLVLVVELD